VAEVKQLVESSKAELEKRESEKAARMELQDTISTLRNAIDRCKKEVQTTLIGQFGDARGNEALTALDALLEKVDAVSPEESDLNVYRKGVEKLQKDISNKVQEVQSLTKGIQAERKDAFAKRMGMFNKGKPAEKKEEKLLTPEEFLKKEGLLDHEDPFLEICDAITMLRFENCTRASIKRCTDHFIKFGYSNQAEKPEHCSGEVMGHNLSMVSLFG